jgi:hypothetical protein
MAVMFRLVTAAAAVAALGSAAAAPAAQAARLSDRIVVQKSIGGFSDGVTPAAVKRRLGRPSETIRVSGRIAELIYRNDQISFDFDTLQRSDPADLVGAIGPRFHTSKGIRVGSSERAVKRAYHGLKCGNGLCTMYTGTPGATGTVSTGFTFFGGKVTSIDIQRVYE